MRHLLICLILWGAWIAASAQDLTTDVASERLPDAPSMTMQTASAASSSSQAPQGGVPNSGVPKSEVPADELQTKRQMGILPNFRSVSPGEVVAPPTVKQRFITTAQDNFDYSALMFDGLIALDSEATNSTPEFHKGMPGFARYYWHTVADQSVENFFVEFIIPTVRHEDSRYYAMGRRGGGVFKRAGYSLSRVVVTRSDAGKPMFNDAEVFGSGMAASVSTLYYPSRERTAGNVLRNWGLDITYDAVTFMFHEFWPDIAAKLASKK